MYVFLDTNIFISDPWLRSQRYRLLLDFLAKTQGKLIVLESVNIEIRSVLRRKLSSAAKALEKAKVDAEIVGLVDSPDFVAEEAAKKTFEQWEKHLAIQFRRFEVKQVALDPTILREVFVRGADRVPPAREDGKESRDVIIWLSFLRAIATMKGNDIAFISSNTKDFANLNGTDFRPELRRELADQSSKVRYYKTLDDFNLEHVAPLAHINNDWVLARFSSSNINEMITEYVERMANAWDYRINDDRKREAYRANEIADREPVEAELTDVLVWDTSSDALELTLAFSVRQSAALECELVNPPILLGDAHERETTKRDWRNYRLLNGELDATVHISAVAKGSELQIRKVEDMYV